MHLCLNVWLGVKAWNYVTSMVPNLWLFIYLLWLHSVKCGWIRPLRAVCCWHSHKTLGSFQSSSGFWCFLVCLCCWKFAGEVFHWMVFPPVPRPGDYHALCYDTLVSINWEQLLPFWRCCCVLSEHRNRLLLWPPFLSWMYLKFFFSQNTSPVRWTFKVEGVSTLKFHITVGLNVLCTAVLL